MIKGISLVALACLFFSLGKFALAEEDSPHFFGKVLRPKASFQKAELEETASDSSRLFERKKFPAKRLFGQGLELSFLFDSIVPIKRLFSLSGVRRIHVNVEVDIVFKDENK